MSRGYQYRMPEWQPLIDAWHARHRQSPGMHHAALLRLLLWGDAGSTRVQRVDRCKGDVVGVAFHGDDHTRIICEAVAADETVRD